MNTHTNKYRFVALILLTLILSHITIFHFEMGKMVLCIGEGSKIYVESVEASHLNSNILVENKTNNNFNNNDCTDYKLDHHIDEDFVKSGKQIFKKLKILLTINIDNLSSHNFAYNSRYISVLTNNFSLNNYSTISLLI